MSQPIIDLSHPLANETPPFPGNPPVEIVVQATIPEGHPTGVPGAMNVSRLHTGLHVGTHLDAPFHFFREGATIDQIPLSDTIGPAVLINLGPKSPQSEITPQELFSYEEAIRRTRRLVLNTGWATHWGEADYFTHHPVISAAAAQLLVSWGVVLVGIDTPSVDVYPHPAHFAFLGNGALIVENLTNLDCIPQMHFQFVAIPLKITARDASPVRAVAILSPPYE